MVRNLLIKFSGELYFAFEDLLINNHRVVVIEGVDTSNHLIGQNAQGPPVDWLSVSLIQKHFRRQILGRSAQCVSSGLTVLSKAEICQLQVAVLVDENVLWLQISVDDVLRMQILKHKCYLRRIEPVVKSYNDS